MNRRKTVARNIVLLVVLSYLFLNVAGLYLSPISAHEQSERGMHYGPSEIVHIADFPGGKLILAKYDRWVTCNAVYRTLHFFWRFGSATVHESDQSKPLDYSWGTVNGFCRFYGIVNDRSIKVVEITFADGTITSRPDFHDNLFLFIWEDNDERGRHVKSVRGYDAEGRLMFEEETGY